MAHGHDDRAVVGGTDTIHPGPDERVTERDRGETAPLQAQMPAGRKERRDEQPADSPVVEPPRRLTRGEAGLLDPKFFQTIPEFHRPFGRATLEDFKAFSPFIPRWMTGYPS